MILSPEKQKQLRDKLKLKYLIERWALACDVCAMLDDEDLTPVIPWADTHVNKISKRNEDKSNDR